MANIYVSNAGSNTAPYDTWAKAATTFATAYGAESAGDAIYVSSTHSESATGATQTIALAGTNASPNKIIVGSTAAAPPTTSGTGIVISTGAGAYNISITGSSYFYGMIFKAGVGSSTNAWISLCGSTSATQTQTYQNCEFWISTSYNSSNSYISLMPYTVGYANKCELINCSVKFAQTSQTMTIASGGLHWNGGGFVAGTAAITTMFTNLDRYGGSLIENCDFSAGAAAMNIYNVSSSHGSGTHVMRNCKLPASWSGSLVTGTLVGIGLRFKMHNCDSGDTNYRLWEQDYAGSVVQETTILRTGGASDGTTSISWKMTSTANAEWPSITFYSPEIAVWSDTTGSKTVTVEFLIDSATTLYTSDVFMDVSYLGTSGYPLGTSDLDSRADPLVTTTECTTGCGVANWSGDGAGAKSYKLVSTITTAEKGWIIARVGLSKASTTIYVDPVITLT